jgi:hypothetical protein
MDKKEFVTKQIERLRKELSDLNIILSPDSIEVLRSYLTTCVLETSRGFKKDLIKPDTVTFVIAKQKKSISELLYVLFRKLFRTQIEQGYEYCDGYNFREALVRSQIVHIEEELK